MALQKDIKLKNGLNIDEAYIRIDTVSGYKGSLDIGVNSYVSQRIFVDGQEYLEQKIYNFEPSVDDNADNFIKQGYEYLKKLPEYEGAIDILDEGQIAQ